jgi:hypothetical protein
VTPKGGEASGLDHSAVYQTIGHFDCVCVDMKSEMERGNDKSVHLHQELRKHSQACASKSEHFELSLTNAIDNKPKRCCLQSGVPASQEVKEQFASSGAHKIFFVSQAINNFQSHPSFFVRKMIAFIKLMVHFVMMFAKNSNCR